MTMSSLVGCSVPLRGVITLVTRPDAVFVASDGGAATSGGGAILESAEGVCANAAEAANRNASARDSLGIWLVIVPVVFCLRTSLVLPPGENRTCDFHSRS